MSTRQQPVWRNKVCRDTGAVNAFLDSLPPVIADCAKVVLVNRSAERAEKLARQIRDEGGSLITIPLRRTQEIILRKLGEMEASTAARNDGVLALVLKARQLGVSTLTELLIAHKALFYSHRHCLIASDIPENSAYLFDMIERVYENLPWWLQPTKTEHVKNDEIVFGKIDTRIKVGWGNATRGQRGTARARRRWRQPASAQG